jgi:Leucine-rich repeat (LRR) protein
VSHAFIDTPNIVLLDLSYNNLKSEDFYPEIFKGPESDEKYAPIHLKFLSLRHNKIKFFGERDFEHTPELELLDLSHNPLNGFEQGTAKALASLKKLLVSCFTSLLNLIEPVFDLFSRHWT